MIGPDGKPVMMEREVTDSMCEAMAALLKLTDEQRGRVLCWFCGGCCRYVGPGDRCHCENDE